MPDSNAASVKVFPNSIQKRTERYLTIHDLPNEILRHVFHCGCDEWPDYTGRNITRHLHSFIIPLCLVCSRWWTLLSENEKVLEKFHYTYAYFSIEPNPYMSVLNFSEYRTTLLSSGSSQLLVWLDCNAPDGGPEMHGLQIHAIDLAFQHRQHLSVITAFLGHPELVKHFAWHVRDSTNFNFEWGLWMSPKDWEHLLSPSLEYSYRDFKVVIPPGLLDFSMRGYSNYCASNILLKIFDLDTDFSEKAWSSVSGLFRYCTNLTSLTLGELPTIDNERPISRFSLPSLQKLTLWNPSTYGVQYLFSSMELPRLWKLTTTDAIPFYPLHLVSLPPSLNTIVCEAYASNIDNILQQLSNLKEVLSCRLVSEIYWASKEYSYQFSCTMAPDNSTPWTMKISTERNRLRRLLRFVKVFRSVFQDELYFSHDGTWLDSVNQCIADLELRIQESNVSHESDPNSELDDSKGNEMTDTGKDENNGEGSAFTSNSRLK